MAPHDSEIAKVTTANPLWITLRAGQMSNLPYNLVSRWIYATSLDK